MAKKLIISSSVLTAAVIVGAIVTVVEDNKQNSNLVTNNQLIYDQALSPNAAPVATNPFVPSIIKGVNDLSSNSAQNPLANISLDADMLKTFLITYGNQNQSTFNNYFWNVVTPIFNPTKPTLTTTDMANKIATEVKNLFIVNPLVDPRLVLVDEIKNVFGPTFTPTFSNELENGQHTDLITKLITNLHAHLNDDSLMKKTSVYAPFVAFETAKTNFPADVQKIITDPFSAYSTLLNDWGSSAKDVESFYNNAIAQGYVDQQKGDNFVNSFSLVFKKMVGQLNNQSTKSSPNAVVTSFNTFIASQKSSALNTITDSSIKTIVKTELDKAETTQNDAFLVRFNGAVQNNFDWLTNFKDFLDYNSTPESVAFQAVGANALADLKTKVDNLTKNLISTISYSDYKTFSKKSPLTMDDILTKSAATTTALNDLVGTSKPFATNSDLSKLLKPKIEIIGSNYDHAYITYGFNSSLTTIVAGNSNSAIAHSKEIPITYALNDYENEINNGDWTNQTIQDPTTKKGVDWKELQNLSTTWTNPTTGFSAFNSLFSSSLNTGSIGDANLIALSKLKNLVINKVTLKQGSSSDASKAADVTVELELKDSTNQIAHVHFTLKNIPFTNPKLTNNLKASAQTALAADKVYVNGTKVQSQANSSTLPTSVTYVLSENDPNLQTVVDKANEVFVTITSQINFFNLFKGMPKNATDKLTINVELPSGNVMHPSIATVTINADNTSEPLSPKPTPVTLQMKVLWLDDEKALATTSVNKDTTDFKDLINQAQGDQYLSQSSIDALQKTIDSNSTKAISGINITDDPTLPNVIATNFKNELDKQKPKLDFLNSKMGNDIIDKIKKPDGTIDFNNPDLVKYKNFYDKFMGDPKYAKFWDQLKTMNLKDFEGLSFNHLGSLGNINGIILKVMTGLGALMGATGIGLSSSVIATAIANKRLKNRKDNTIRFQGIKKLFSFQTMTALASLGASAALLIYVFIVKGGF